MYLPNMGGEKSATASGSRLFQEFIGRTGKGWSVRWNLVTGTPRLITGRALALPGVTTLTAENIEQCSLDFVTANAELLQAKPAQLRLAGAAKAGGRWYVSFQQVHKDVPVLGGRVTMSFTKDDRLIMFGSDVYPDVVAETEPTVGRKEAERVARQDCRETAGNDRVSEVQLCIVPVRRVKRVQYLLCWKLDIFQPLVHKKWEYLVDAMSGKIVSKRNVLVYENVTGSAQGEYKPEFAGDAVQVGAFAHGTIGARGAETVIASWNFDTDPDWSTEGGWAFGIPTGSGTSCSGPTSGYTGSNVYGYNLDGDYENNMPAYYLTTGLIDCSGHEDVQLKFVRWLSVESSYYDNASIEVSNNGTNWTSVWSNPTSSICDGQWVTVSYDISEVAAMQPAVYIRWVMGPTDSSVIYPGWNIDDVEMVSYTGGINTTETQADGSYSIVPPWAPCTVTSELAGLYCDINYECGQDARFEQENVYPGDVVDFTWDGTSYNEIVESSVYWHANYIHDYYIGMDPSLSESSGSFPLGMDYPMPVTVQAGCQYGYCNAYWDGTGMTFGAGDGWFCDDFGLYSEVVYHEYTHGVTSRIYDGSYLPYIMESGALNEGWSDYFGCVLSPSQSPLVGDGGLLLGYPEGFRTLDNTYRRETDWYNEVHADSEMFSGGLWEARQVMDGAILDELVHFARYAHAQTFEEYVLAILVEDDTRYGDSDLGNGTPHGQAIYTGFGNHGIGGLQYLAPSTVIDDANSNSNGKLEPGETVNLSVTLTNGWANATDVQATLSTTDSFVTIAKGVAGFGDPNHGELVGNAADPFVITLDPCCPQTHTINFTLDVTANGPYGYSRECLFTYAVAAGQLAYDDGQVDAYLGWGTPGGGLAVRVTPQTYPRYPTHIRFFPLENSTITVTVWDDDGPGGLPGTVLAGIETNVNAAGGWFDVDVSHLGLTIDSGSIYVGWLEGGTTYYNGMDMDPPYNGQSWVYYFIPPFIEEWMPLESAGFLANLMVRVRYADEPLFIINPPFECTWGLGQPVSECLSARNGTEPYHDWTAVAIPLDTYSYSVLGSGMYSPSGVAQGWHADDRSWNYVLPFGFPYYGSTCASVNICSNGFLDFAGMSSNFFNSTEELSYNVRIAPLWDDLRTDINVGDDIYIDQSIAGQVMIRWQGVTYETGQPVNFDVVLFEDGRIRFDYGDGNNYLTPTIGISAGDGTDYTLVTGYDGAGGLTNANSVLLDLVDPCEMPLPPGITLAPDTGCLSGIPTTPGHYAAIIQVTDSSPVPETTSRRFDFHVLPPVIFACDFEQGLCGFTIDNDFGDGGGLWHETTSCRSGLSGHTVPTSLYYGLDSQCNYDAGQTEGVVTSPVISLPAGSETTMLSFKYYLATERAPAFWDIATVEVSENGGPFNPIASNSDGSLADPSIGWSLVSVDLPVTAGSDIQIRFRFRTVDSVLNQFAGFYVDDVEIRGGGLPPMEVAMRFTPQALNPGSQGKWVKAHLVLPEDFAVEDVDADTPALINELGIESDYVNVFVNEDDLVEVEAAFDRADFCAGTDYGPAEVTVTGLLTSGQSFYGTDTIRIISNKLAYIAVVASHWLETGCGQPGWCDGFDLDQNSTVDFVDFALLEGCCIEIITE